MNKNKTIKLLMTLILAFLLFGCASDSELIKKGDEAFSNSDMVKALEYYDKISGVYPEETLRNMLVCAATDQDKQLEIYQRLYDKGCFQEADYLAMSDLYGDDNKLAKRNMLEQGYTYFHNPEMLSKLSEISIDLNEEQEDIKNTLLGYLNDYQTVDLNYFSTLFKSTSIERNYFYNDQRIVIDINGIQLWIKEGNRIKYVRINNQEYFVGTTEYKDGAYFGPYEYVYSTSDGRTIKENGTFQNNICVGEVTTIVYRGDGSDISTVYQDYAQATNKTYTGSFNDKGLATVEQRTSAGVTYGISKNGTIVDYVYIVSTKKASEFVFEADSIGFRGYPQW